MLSRRALFRGGLAATGAAGTPAAAPPPLFAQAAAPPKAPALTPQIYEMFPP